MRLVCVRDHRNFLKGSGLLDEKYTGLVSPYHVARAKLLCSLEFRPRLTRSPPGGQLDPAEANHTGQPDASTGSEEQHNLNTLNVLDIPVVSIALGRTGKWTTCINKFGPRFRKL
jgi:hypothetical protein